MTAVLKRMLRLGTILAAGVVALVPHSSRAHQDFYRAALSGDYKKVTPSKWDKTQNQTPGYYMPEIDMSKIKLYPAERRWQGRIFNDSHSSPAEKKQLIEQMRQYSWYWQLIPPGLDEMMRQHPESLNTVITDAHGHRNPRGFIVPAYVFGGSGENTQMGPGRGQGHIARSDQFVADFGDSFIDPLFSFGWQVATSARMMETVPDRPIYPVDTRGLSREGLDAAEMVAGALGRNIHWYRSTPIFPLTIEDMIAGRGLGAYQPVPQLGFPRMMEANPGNYVPELRTPEGRLQILSGGADNKHKLHYNVINLIGIPMPWIVEKQLDADVQRKGIDNRNHNCSYDGKMKVMSIIDVTAHIRISDETRAVIIAYILGVMSEDSARYAQNIERLRNTFPELLRRHGVVDAAEVAKRFEGIWPKAIADARQTSAEAGLKSAEVISTCKGGAKAKDYFPFGNKSRRPEVYALDGDDRGRNVFKKPTAYVENYLMKTPEKDTWQRPRVKYADTWLGTQLVLNKCSQQSKQSVTPNSGHSPGFENEVMVSNDSTPLPPGYQYQFKDYRKNPPPGEDKPLGKPGKPEKKMSGGTAGKRAPDVRVKTGK